MRCSSPLLATALAVGLASHPHPGVAAAPEDFSSCAARINAEPTSYDAHMCVYRVVTAGGAHAEGDALLAAAATPLSDVVRGHLWVARDESRALERYAAALAAFAAAPAATRSLEGEVAARWNVAAILKRRGDLEGAWREIEAAKRITTSDSPPAVRIRVLVAEASFLSETGGDLERAERGFAEAATLLPPAGTATPYRRVLQREMAFLRTRQGRRAAAIIELERLIELATAEGARLEAATATFNLAQAHWGDYVDSATRSPAALADLTEAVETARAAATAVDNAVLLLRVDELAGHVARAEGRPEAARHLYDASVASARQEGHPDNLAKSLWARAELAAATRESFAAERVAAATRAMEAITNQRILAILWSWRMRASWELHPPEEALIEASSALDAIENLRLGQASEGERIAVYADWVRDYRWLAGRLLERFATQPNEAFAVLERARARALYENLRGARITSGAPEPARPLATLAEVRAALRPNEALLYFQVDDERDAFGEPAGGSWALRITRDGERLERLAGRAELEALAEGFRAVLDRPDLVEPAARRLGTVLLGGALAGLTDREPEIDRLLVIPDGVLHQLPFEALRLDGPEPLGIRFEIATLPSASLLVAARQASAPSALPSRALLLADPHLESLPRAETATTRTEERGSLPYARREVRSIARRFGRASQILEGERATESAFSAALAESGDPIALVHLATHAIVEPGDPARSAVLLATDSNADGRLEPAEIARLDLRGRLVVLSACRSAAGDIAGGEGPLSLARAFLKAGASAVVASRWPLRDDEAAEFFAAFHDRWSRGATAAEAAREARRARQRAGSPVMLWAGVTLIGDPEARLATPATPARTGLAIWLALGSILIVIVGSRMARRRRETGRR